MRHVVSSNSATRRIPIARSAVAVSETTSARRKRRRPEGMFTG
jgi:hypothetical protein